MATDFTKLKVTKTVARTDILFGLARVPKTSRVFVGSSDFKLYDVDFAQEKPEPQEIGAHESYITSVAMIGDDVVVTGGYDCKLTWWDVAAKKSLRSIDAHTKRIRQVVASPDGKLVATTADDMLVKLWDAKTGKAVREFKGHEPFTPHHFANTLCAVAFSADGKRIAAGDKSGKVVVWNAADGKEVGTLDASGVYTWDPVARRHSIGGIRSVAFSPDGATLAVGGVGKIGNIDHLDAPGRLEVFDVASGKQTFVLQTDSKHKGLIERLIFSPDGKWLVGAGGGTAGFIAFYDVKAGKILFQDAAPMHVHGLAMNEAGDTLFASGHNKLVEWSING